MAHEAQLLRMLEPVSRPLGTPAPASTGRASFDSIDFAATLRQVSQAENGSGVNTSLNASHGTQASDGMSFLREAARTLLREEMESMGVDMSAGSIEGAEANVENNSVESASLKQLGQVTHIENMSLIQTLANAGAGIANPTGQAVTPGQVTGTLI